MLPVHLNLLLGSFILDLLAALWPRLLNRNHATDLLRRFPIPLHIHSRLEVRTASWLMERYVACYRRNGLRDVRLGWLELHRGLTRPLVLRLRLFGAWCHNVHRDRLVIPEDGIIHAIFIHF